MTTIQLAVGAPAAHAAKDLVPPATQNLFEYAAAQARSMSAGAGPTELGQEMLNGLQGFLDRSTNFSERVHAPMKAETSVDSHKATGIVRGGFDAHKLAVSNDGRAPVHTGQMDQIIQSLSMMFDHSIETQMVVRGTTQVAGAANTLLRGQ